MLYLPGDVSPNHILTGIFWYPDQGLLIEYEQLAAPDRPLPVLQILAMAGFMCDFRLEPDIFSLQSVRA